MIGRPPKPLDERLKSRLLRKPNGCLEIVGGRDKDGYGQIKDSTGKVRRAHQAAWELVNGPMPSGFIICHKCDNPPCCEPSHLFLGTHKDNASDREYKGRANRPFGELHSNSKLSDSQVKEILSLKGFLSQNKIAIKYNISQTHVGRIHRGERRKALEKV